MYFEVRTLRVPARSDTALTRFLSSKNHGFSLVELAIVMVVVGLIIGGVAVGQSLVKAAEIRSVSSDFQLYQSASRTFFEKYNAFPGDMSNATSYWGSGSCPGTLGSTTVTTTTCDGDADNKVETGLVGSSYENFRYWQHLSNAGLIGGTYTGVPSILAQSRSAQAGVNCPKNRIAGAGFGIETPGLLSSDSDRWDGLYNNAFIFGAYSANYPPQEPVLLPEDAWNIDTKIDDANPGFGNVRSFRQTGSWTNCVTTNVQSSAAYNLSDTTRSCALIFPGAF